MTIYPGIGIGKVRYGISEKDLTLIMGKPDSISQDEMIEGSGDWYKTYEYTKYNLSFDFSLEDDYRLGGITVYSNGHELFGRDVFGLSKVQVEKIIKTATGCSPSVEDFSNEYSEDYYCLSDDISGILYWFESDSLTELQCGYLFEDDDNTVIWASEPKLTS